MIGAQAGLTMMIREYEPYVHCEPHPPSVPSREACNAAVASMPTETKKYRFHHERPGYLPRSFDKGKLQVTSLLLVPWIWIDDSCRLALCRA